MVSSARNKVTSSSAAVSSIMPTVAQNISARYSPHSSVKFQAIESQSTSPSKTT
jgi:hypothetical protein